MTMTRLGLEVKVGALGRGSGSGFLVRVWVRVIVPLVMVWVRVWVRVWVKKNYPFIFQ